MVPGCQSDFLLQRALLCRHVQIVIGKGSPSTARCSRTSLHQTMKFEVRPGRYTMLSACVQGGGLINERLRHFISMSSEVRLQPHAEGGGWHVRQGWQALGRVVYRLRTWQSAKIIGRLREPWRSRQVWGAPIFGLKLLSCLVHFAAAPDC
jgi:hypothetical protein